MVVNELRGEKIDVVPWSANPAELVANALQPAKVKEVRIDEATSTALVIVPDYQLSLAIGKEGQNARLAARLTGWRIDIKSEAQVADESRPAAAAPAEVPVAAKPPAEAASDPAASSEPVDATAEAPAEA
jgi:N utilization substance protein A